MHIPRRHHRRLLLPPGLVALAWLLLLGRVAMPWVNHPRQAIMQIALPDPKASAGSKEAFPTLQQLEAFGAWQDFTVMGNVWSDYFDVRMVESACFPLSKEQNQHRALRVFVSESTTYNTFVQLVDLAHRLDIRRYWLDFRKPPYTFNLIGNEPPGPQYYHSFCSNGYYQSQTDVKPLWPFSDKVAEWLTNRSTDLLTPEWRNTWLLLLLLSLISTWKLTRLRIADRY